MSSNLTYNSNIHALNICSTGLATSCCSSGVVYTGCCIRVTSIDGHNGCSFAGACYNSPLLHIISSLSEVTHSYGDLMCDIGVGGTLYTKVGRTGRTDTHTVDADYYIQCMNNGTLQYSGSVTITDSRVDIIAIGGGANGCLRPATGTNTSFTSIRHNGFPSFYTANGNYLFQLGAGVVPGRGYGCSYSLDNSSTFVQNDVTCHPQRTITDTEDYSHSITCNSMSSNFSRVYENIYVASTVSYPCNQGYTNVVENGYTITKTASTTVTPIGSC